jgi:hypothetical protein
MVCVLEMYLPASCAPFRQQRNHLSMWSFHHVVLCNRVT